MKIVCSLCKRDRDADTCTTLTLTPEEQMALRGMGESNPPATLSYCRPCYRLLSNQKTALEMMAGLVEANLRSAGVPDAEQRARRFKSMMLGASTTKKG